MVGLIVGLIIGIPLGVVIHARLLRRHVQKQFSGIMTARFQNTNPEVKSEIDKYIEKLEYLSRHDKEMMQ